MKNNTTLVRACYFFMDKTNVIIVIINIIMYTYSIVITSLYKGDGITAQLGLNAFYCFWSCLGFYYNIIFLICQQFFMFAQTHGRATTKDAPLRVKSNYFYSIYARSFSRVFFSIRETYEREIPNIWAISRCGIFLPPPSP